MIDFLLCQFGCVFVCQFLASVSSFGQLLRCADKCVVDITKVYIERNNRQVELTQFQKTLISFTFTFAKEEVNTLSLI